MAVKELKIAKVSENLNRWIKAHAKKISAKIIVYFLEGGITSWKTEGTFKPKKIVILETSSKKEALPIMLTKACIGGVFFINQNQNIIEFSQLKFKS